MSKINLDEEFLRWWAEGLEREGINIDEATVKAATQREKPFLFRDYTYREFFEAMRNGEYWPLVSYKFAYCLYVVIEKKVRAKDLDQNKEIVPFWEKSGPRE